MTPATDIIFLFIWTYLSIILVCKTQKEKQIMDKQPVVTGIDEQETVINFARNDKNMSLYTCDSTMITKLTRLGYSIPEKDFAGGVTIEVPVKLLSFRAFKDKKEAKAKSTTRGQHMKGRTLSEEQKAKMKAGRLAKKQP